ncbi:MAG: DUF1266 domain-containing protein [Actinophytocola sp.]|uniref:DUF1266 domain-containing protein n=1 Tax=Actinophytocola sp. TaxID=1872138 RepID=UPI0013286BA0|nr:DUF1266 domain-containing protein [Actinophytocola sp.]MPZ79324.1 DUF1266 domain-containing protein [Actinophytocola sp.]
MIDDLQAQLGGMFWVIAIGAPVLVLVLVLQVALKTRLKTKQLKQVFRAGSIVTDRSAPTTGPLAFGLACGAHMAINQGVAWNDPAGGGFTKLELRMRPAGMWDVHSATDWQRTMDRLLAERGEKPADLAVRLRRQAVTATGVVPDLAGWHRIIEQAAQTGRIGMRGVPLLTRAAERISRYEDRFRADGILPPNGVVASLRAYDWGRAVTMARWGMRAGYCDRVAAERGVLRAGDLCARHYGSWAELSAGFGMGRMLSFDDEDFPVHHVEVREAHRKLLAEDASPWRTMPWPAPARAA